MDKQRGSEVNVIPLLRRHHPSPPCNSFYPSPSPSAARLPGKVAVQRARPISRTGCCESGVLDSVVRLAPSCRRRCARVRSSRARSSLKASACRDHQPIFHRPIRHASSRLRLFSTSTPATRLCAFHASTFSLFVDPFPNRRPFWSPFYVNEKTRHDVDLRPRRSDS